MTFKMYFFFFYRVGHRRIDRQMLRISRAEKITNEDHYGKVGQEDEK